MESKSVVWVFNFQPISAVRPQAGNCGGECGPQGHWYGASPWKYREYSPGWWSLVVGDSSRTA
eukprot:4013672-Lingulodinium_polyedra.AAC.1